MPGPIFIIGAMGSGTTLLRLMLDSHEHIAIPHETGFMRSYRAMQFIPFKWTGRGWARRLGWTDEELDVELRAFYDKVFSRYATEHGAQRWGEKTPLHTWHVSAMARLFPDSVFIGMVRHPGASTASNMKRFHHRVNRMSIHYDRYTREVVRQVISLPRRSVLVRYEDLVLQPEPTMRELLSWLAEPWSDKVLEHHVVQGERSGRVEGQSRADEPIDASRIAKWKQTLPKDDRRVVRRRIGPVGDFLGYSMSDPTALEPLSRDGTILVRGPDLEARRAAHPKVDVVNRAPVPIFEHHYNPRKFWLVRNETGEPPQPERPKPTLARRAVMRMPPVVRRQVWRVSKRVRGGR